MKRIIIQVYEIQEPHEAERLVALGVDHVGGVILSETEWKSPVLRDAVRLVQDSPAKSCLIPLMAKTDNILRALDYYQPQLVHFCEAIPLDPGDGDRRARACAELVRVQQRVRREFPPFGIIRSIPIPAPGLADPAPAREAVLEIARTLAPHSDFFLTDTLLGFQDPTAGEPVAGYVGITGKVCDWTLAAALVEASPIPVILAGGISPENVFDGIRRVSPAGIDSCTQTNARDPRTGRPIRFRKDFDRVRRLIDEVRRAEAEA